MIVWVNLLFWITIICVLKYILNKIDQKFEKQEDLVRLATFETKRLNEILIKLPNALKINK